MIKTIKSLVINNSPESIIKFFARPYVAGFSLDAAIAQVDKLYSKNILSTVDILGEEAETDEDIVRYMSIYNDLIKKLAENFEGKENSPTISIKPSCLAKISKKESETSFDETICLKNIKTLAENAVSNKLGVTIDMEDHSWTDFTLNTYKTLTNNNSFSIGTVLQSMLFRTEKDIDDLPENSRIRICLGIYKEPPNIAHTQKPLMKKQLFKYVEKLFNKGVYTEIATHDENLIEDIIKNIIIPKNISNDNFEIQMLMGVERSSLHSKLIEGTYPNYPQKVKVRLYVPFAIKEKDAMHYLKRRLIANPDIIGYGLKAFLLHK